jgi:hypothetical protein
MSNQAITAAVSQLKQEHIRLCKELERVDQALSVLGSLDGVKAKGKPGRPAKVVATVSAGSAKPKRKISPAARKKMAEAARARWAAARAVAAKKAPAKA